MDRRCIIFVEKDARTCPFLRHTRLFCNDEIVSATDTFRLPPFVTLFLHLAAAVVVIVP